MVDDGRCSGCEECPVQGCVWSRAVCTVRRLYTLSVTVVTNSRPFHVVLYCSGSACSFCKHTTRSFRSTMQEIMSKIGRHIVAKAFRTNVDEICFLSSLHPPSIGQWLVMKESREHSRSLRQQARRRSSLTTWRR